MYTGKQKVTIDTSLFTSTQPHKITFASSPLNTCWASIVMVTFPLSLIIQLLLTWTMKAAFPNISCLESRILVSKSWVAFFLLYQTLLNCLQSPEANPLLRKLPARSPWGAHSSHVWTGNPSSLIGQRQSPDQAWQSSISFQGLRTVTESQLVSLRGWLEL